MTGCTNLNAIDYNPLATEDDSSCHYIIDDKEEVAHEFHDFAGLEDTSFTLSYSVEGDNWVFFHDYIPDFYFHTREKLWSVKNKQVYKHNDGVPGVYYNEDPKPFFIDVVFRSDSDLLLETVNWITEVINSREDNANVEQEWQTLTHISVWNSQQHSGRVALADVLDPTKYKTDRRTKGEWSFNDFRNVLADRGIQFLQDIFKDYALVPGVQVDKAWYEKELMEDKYFVIRFEFDNKSGKQMVIHQTNIQALKSNR